ncbi:MAG: LPS assembly protein LptD [Planctomycetota bacterium]
MTNSIVILMVVLNGLAAGQPPGRSVSVAGQDLHVAAPTVITCSEPMPGWSDAMLLDGGVSVQIGDNLLSGRSAVIWLQPQGAEQAAYGAGQAYLARLYLEGDVAVQKGPKSRATAVQHFEVEGAEVLLTQFTVTGEVFASTDSQQQITSEFLPDYEIYGRAFRVGHQIPYGPAVRVGARVPNVDEVVTRPADEPDKKPRKASSVAIAEQLDEATTRKEEAPAQTEPGLPVHVSALWEPAPQIRRSVMPDGQEVYTASGRFYVWQKRPEGRVVEFMADDLVLFTQPGNFSLERQRGNEIGMGKIQSVYLFGNIVMTENNRTIRCDEIYYDFSSQRALVVNASLRVFDEDRGLPIYLRAKKLGRVSEDIFEARDVQLTSSEFYLPQISVNASEMVLLKGEALEQHYRLTEQKDVAGQYEGRLVGVNAKVGDFTFFGWPKMVTNFARPDIPLRRVRVGNDSEFGTSVETRWHLARLLGLRDPAWMESQLALDYFSDRGVGAGVGAEYETDDAKGSFQTYIIDDRGEDDLSRYRKNIDPEQDIRGRFSFRHRQYLPDDWQLTTEVGYLSDRNFQEWMYQNEFYNDKAQETLVYLKRIRDNWAFSILGKVRINDFETTTEELPSLEYHLKGQSFWDHQLTFYSDTQVARFREQFDEDAILGPQDTSDFYTYAFTRNEVDWPLMWETIKLVPYVAGSSAYEDNYGYQTEIDGAAASGEDDVLLGEVGLRASTMFWSQDPFVRSMIWDLNGMRHLITPYVEAVMYEASDDVIDMRDSVHVGISQRWQTHRGSEKNRRSLDWMRLDVESTWVSDDADSSIGPYQTYGLAAFVYNDPSIPFLPRRNDSYFGVARDTVNGEYLWRVSDTFSLLSDFNYDLDGGCIQQADIGVSRYVYPDVSYYLGTRYLRPVLIPVDKDNNGIPEYFEKGSNSVVGAMTYRLSPRYVATFSQEYNFDFGKAIRSDLTIVRQYHRLFYALSFSFDASLDRSAVMFSVWPQGVKELAVGSRKYVGLTGSQWED